MVEWPKQGRCGACGRPAEQTPSLRWWHKGRPCRARCQSIWRPDDWEIKQACRFIPEGEPLPHALGWHMHITQTNESGFPTELAPCNADHSITVREFLAREAEEGIRA